jgi:hypothetical protein
MTREGKPFSYSEYLLRKYLKYRRSRALATSNPEQLAARDASVHRLPQKSPCAFRRLRLPYSALRVVGELSVSQIHVETSRGIERAVLGYSLAFDLGSGSGTTMPTGF